MDDSDVHPYQESESSDETPVKREFNSKAEAMKYIKNGGVDNDDDDLDENDPNIKGAIFTRSSNVKKRLKQSFIPFEKDLYMIKRLVDEKRWDHRICHELYWERVYQMYNGQAWVTCVETSAALSRMRNANHYIKTAATKKRCRRAFTDEEFRIIQQIWKDSKSFVDNEGKARITNARSVIYNFGLCGKQFAEDCDEFEKIIM